MKANIFHERGSIPRLNYLADGLERAGWEVEILNPENPEFKPCDVAVVSGALKRYGGMNAKIFFFYRSRKIPVFVAEHGRLVDTTNGCRHWLLYLNRIPMVAKIARGMTDDRRLELGLTCDFKKRGEDVLIVGQDREIDCALKEYLVPWLREYTSRKIIYRPRKEVGPFIGVCDWVDEVSANLAVNDDLARAWCVITGWSNMGCEALMRGVPVICNPCAAYAYLGHDDPSLIDSLPTPRQGDVEEFLVRYSYTIWGNEELAEGFQFLLENQR